VSRPARLALILVASTAATMALFWGAALFHPAAYDYAEGDTATWVWLLRHGQAVYGPLVGLPMRYSNYPPLHLHLIAALAPSDGAILITGRLLSMLGLVVACATVGWAVHAATLSRRAAVGAAVLFAITLRVGYYAATCRADTLALGVGALGVVLGARRVRGWPLWAALLFSVAALLKHSLICFPLGLTIWALRREPRKAILMGGLTALIVGVAVWRFGLLGPLLVWSRAPWDLHTWWLYMWLAVGPSIAALVISTGVVWRWPPQLSPRARLMLEPWVAVFLVGVVWTFALGRKGASTNYVLELNAAMTIITVVAVEEGLVRRLFHLHLFCVWVETTIWVGFLLFQVLPNARAENAIADRALEGVSGPVFAEQSWQTTSKGRPPLVIPFLSTQLALSGHWNATPFVDSLERGEVQRLLLNFPLEAGVESDPLHQDRFLPAELAAMRAHYRLIAHGGDLYVYAPR
jgi:hypothetical protein